MNIILSIHPKWAKLIYEGKKTVEWRKTVPHKLKAALREVFLYETSPVCKVTGYFDLLIPIEIDAVNIRKELDEEYVERGCVPVDDLVKYQGKKNIVYAWYFKHVVKFDQQKTLADFGLKRPPQSWCYTEVDV